MMAPVALKDSIRASRLRRLNRIEKANRLRSWSARNWRALPPALIVLVIIGEVVGWFWWPAGLWGLALGAMVYLDLLGRGGLASRWAARLDRQLSLYDPIDRDAYAVLQRQALSATDLDFYAVVAWLKQERAAVQGPQRPARAWMFAKETTERAEHDKEGPA